MFGIKLPFKTKIDNTKKEDEKKFEQPSMQKIEEPETAVLEIENTLNYMSLYNDKFSNVSQLIDTYRLMLTNFEISEAVEEIENAVIVSEENRILEICTDKTEFSPQIKKRIIEEFEEVLRLLDFSNECYNIFRKWFVEGRMYFQKIMNAVHSRGIEKIVQLDNKKTQRMKSKKTGEIFYQYSKDKEKTYIIPNDAISFINSGLLDNTDSYYVSFLHKCIRPLNNLRLIEDSALVYYITRAPQKRVFYLDIMNTPPNKADEKIKELVRKLVKKISYDQTTGRITQENNSFPVNEDFYLATRGGQGGSKIDILPGDTSLLDPNILAYYKKKLYKSLCVPIARINDDNQAHLDFGNSDITAEELKFYKFVQKLRKLLSKLFDDVLKTQLIAKRIITIADWENNKNKLFYKWNDDSYITMIKKQDILMKQINIATDLQPFIGKVFSYEYLRKNVFEQTEADIEQNDKEIENEHKTKKYLDKE